MESKIEFVPPHASLSSSPISIETEKDKFKRFLKIQGFIFKDYVIDIIYNTIFNLNGSVKALLLRGPAGVGKTSLGELLAKYLGAELVFFQCTYGTSEEDMLYKYVPSEDTKSGIKIALGPIPLALEMSRSKKVVLLIDEFDKTRPSADALLLDVLQNARVSLYLEEEERIIEGKKENLIVVITSNDFREFSEPLVRRVVHVYIEPLPTIEVFKLMLRKFPRNTALLLAQIYDDTIKANLIKPATIQELEQLGKILQKHNAGKVPLTRLIRSFIVKYDDDWKSYLSYVKSGRRPLSWLVERVESNGEDNGEIDEYYDLTDVNTSGEVEGIIDNIEKEAKEQERREDGIILTSNSVVPSDSDHYTVAIQLLKPEPTSNPLVLKGLGEFREEYGELAPIDYEEHRRTMLGYPEKLGRLVCGSQVLFKIYFDNINLNVVDVFDRILYYADEVIRGLITINIDDNCKVQMDTAVLLKENTIEVAVKAPCTCASSNSLPEKLGRILLSKLEEIRDYVL